MLNFFNNIKIAYSFFANKGNGRRWNNGIRLDYFVINKESLDCLMNSEILKEYEGSDHVPIRLMWKNI